MKRFEALLLTVLTLGAGAAPSREPALDLIVGTDVDANVLREQLSRWNGSGAVADAGEAVVYGEGLPELFFGPSARNESLTSADLSRCLADFGLVTCMKFLLVSRLDDAIGFLRENGDELTFLRGLVRLRRTAAPARDDGGGPALGLDDDISRKMAELFRGRTLEVDLLPRLAFEAKLSPPGEELRLSARWRVRSPGVDEGTVAGRKKSVFKMPNMMMLPQLLMFGFMPFALANLQAMVMNAFMLNMMALNSAIFMTIRNLVFGPRGGPRIKYVNYGYRKKKKSTVPTIIIHSPAAFVKQPFKKFRPRPKPVFHGPPPGFHPHHHHEELQVHPADHFGDEPPTSYSIFHSAEPAVLLHDGNFPSGAGNDIEVVPEEGKLDGKNRVRIRVHRRTSVRELLRRVRTIEEKAGRNRLRHPSRDADEPPSAVEFASDGGQSANAPGHIPGVEPDSPASHRFSEPFLSLADGEEAVVDRDQFVPITPYPRRTR